MLIYVRAMAFNALAWGTAYLTYILVTDGTQFVESIVAGALIGLGSSFIAGTEE